MPDPTRRLDRPDAGETHAAPPDGLPDAGGDGRRAALRARLLMAVSALVALGLVMVYSATAVRAQRGGMEWSYALNQLQWLGLGGAGMLAAGCAPARWWRRTAYGLAGAVLVLLVLVRIPGIGTKVGGAYRWFRFGGVSVQPSELAKLAMILALAAFLARRRPEDVRFFRDVTKALLFIGATVGLIVAEPDLGTAALIGGVLGLTLLAGGARPLPLFCSLAALAAPALVFGYAHFEHLRSRLEAWGSAAGQYHTNISMHTIGSGGLFGVGLGRGPAKLAFLPEAHTDFIFAMIGQELGLAGAGVTVALFAWLAWNGLALARACPDRFGRLTVFGITVLFTAQALFNMGVVTGLLPPKGIQLPFVSYGGSGLCVNLALVGLMLSASRARTTDPAGAAADGRAGWAAGVFRRPLPAARAAGGFPENG